MKLSSLEKTLQQAVTLHQAGQISKADILYRQILAEHPDHPEALHYSGILAHQVGKSGVAIELIGKSICHRPDYAKAHNNLGNVLNDQGKLEEAVASYQKALVLEPDFVEAHNNLGSAFVKQGKLEEAVASFNKALTLKPGYIEAHSNLGNALSEQGKLEEAVASFNKALALEPDFVEAHNNLGSALVKQGKLEEAVASFNKALTLKPGYIEAHNNLGNALSEQGKFEEAVASYQKALTLKPDYAETHYNLGNVLSEQCKLEEAVASYRKALTLKPEYKEAYSNLLFCFNYMPGITQEAIYKESLQFGDRFSEYRHQETPTFENDLSKDRRLKVGYVSPDFNSHSVAYFIEPAIKAHNREKVEIFCYANVKKIDEVTKRVQAEADHWCSIVGMKDEDVAARIKKDRIDILVDLAGHTRNNRLFVFALKPAPVQVTWLGFPNTTGLPTMDYRLTDEVADPEGEADGLHIEELIRLKHGFLCYQPMTSSPDVCSLPSQECGYITFGSFNNLKKVTVEVIKAWAGILNAVPSSRLLLKAKQLINDQTRKWIIKILEQEGIAEERIEMHSWMPNQADHLALYSRVDIGLDPFPYNGTTTTCEALWMGVPVITLLGDRHASRVGASILYRVGMNELVASSVEKYIELTSSLANDRKKLIEIRSCLRDRIQKSELVNRRLFADHLEEVYRQMWNRYCAEKSVPADL
jgi:predicted O-linked N-acetylglucosamine transferase (SPINDLY family)